MKRAHDTRDQHAKEWKELLSLRDTSGKKSRREKILRKNIWRFRTKYLENIWQKISSSLLAHPEMEIELNLGILAAVCAKMSEMMRIDGSGG